MECYKRRVCLLEEENNDLKKKENRQIKTKNNIIKR